MSCAANTLLVIQLYDYTTVSGVGVIEVSATFGTQRVLPGNFIRASGIAIGPNQFLYVTDQAANNLFIYDTDRTLISTVNIGNVPTGLDFDALGRLNVCSFWTTACCCMTCRRG